MKHLLFVIFVFHLGALTTGYSIEGDDIVFVLDSSERVGNESFALIKDWLSRLMIKISLGAQYNQVSFISYGGGVHVEQLLGQTKTVSQVQDNIDRFKYYGGASTAGDAIKSAYTNGFSSITGARKDRYQIIVHVGYGGDSKKPDSFPKEVQNAAKEGRVIFNVAIGDNWTQKLLDKSSTSPSSHYVLKVFSAHSINFISDKLVKRWFEEPFVQSTTPAPTTLPPISEVCASEKVDIVFVMSGASSILPHDFQSMKEDLKNVISKLPIGEDGVQVGVLQFSDESQIEIPLNQHLNKTDLAKAIDDIEQFKGETRLDVALSTLLTMFSRKFGARDDANRAGILITDSKNRNFEDLRWPGLLLSFNGVDMVGIGIGPTASRFQLEVITSDESRVYIIDSFANLGKALKRAMATACKVNGTIPPSTKDPITVSMPCVDVDKECQSLVDQYGFDYCRSQQHVEYAKENCTRFCGYCNDSNSVTNGFHGKCLYKGKLYETAESWQDGCNYDCTCVDGSSGTYECFNRCPIYYNLPNHCTLVSKKGDCCLRPVCNFGMQVRHYWQAGNLKDSTGHHACYYGGKFYYENEVFLDGCSYRCHCDHARTGEITCVSLCPKYTEKLPSSCKLVQDEGACCKRLVCSFYTIVGKLTGQITTTGNEEDYDVNDLTCRDKKEDCDKNDKAACTDLQSDVRKNCPSYCDLCEEKYNNSRCYQNGNSYRDGDEWKPNCQTSCVCDNQYTGYYRCFHGCPAYDGYLGVCIKNVNKPRGQCCDNFECPAVRVTNMYPSTTNLLSRGIGQGVYKKSTSGNLTAILPIFTPSGKLKNPEVWPKPIRGCLLDDVVLPEYGMGIDGKCGSVCMCKNETLGEMSCTNRCPGYPEVNGCEMIPSSRDKCCQVPRCPASIKTPSPIYAPAKTIYRPVAPPDPASLIPRQQNA